jgi:ABC-type Zn2+ transport system substrate-binding protein/surface adhesin
MSQQLESRASLLRAQQVQQEELLTTVRPLQSELTSLRHQNITPTVLADNGAGTHDLQGQMMQMTQSLSNEIQMLKQDRQTDMLRAQVQSQAHCTKSSVGWAQMIST